MNFSRVSRIRRNQNLQLLTNAAMPQNRIIRRSSSSNLSDYLGSNSSLNSFSSYSSDSSPSSTPPTTPKYSESPKIPLLEQKAQINVEKARKPGFLSLLATKEATPSENRNIILSHQIKVDNKPLGCSSSAKTKTTFEKNGDELPNASNLDDKPLNNPSSKKISSAPDLIEFGNREIANGGERGLRLCHDAPCIFAPIREKVPYDDLIVKPVPVTSSDRIRGHAIISPQGHPCFRPLTYCSVHKCAGFLRLEDIKYSECYSRVDVTFPYIKATHRYNYCVLEFPPTHNQLIVFKGPKPSNKENDVDDNPTPPTPPVNNLGPCSISNPRPQIKFLKHCMDCYKPLTKKDVYVYRGDAWFCSEYCRYWNTKEGKEQERMALDRQRARIEQANRAKALAEYRQKSNQSQASSSNNDKNKGKAILYIG